MGILLSTAAASRRAYQKFDHDETALLTHTFRSLARSNEGRTINKATFSKVLGLPGILGEALFTSFDTLRNGCIDFDEFIVGLGVVFRGTLEEKMNFAFRIYDLDEKGFVTRYQLSNILRSIVLAAYNVLDRTQDEDFVDNVAFDGINRRVEKLVDAAFFDLHPGQPLSKDAFKSWVVNYTDSLDLLHYVFPGEFAGSDRDQNLIPFPAMANIPVPSPIAFDPARRITVAKMRCCHSLSRLSAHCQQASPLIRLPRYSLVALGQSAQPIPIPRSISYRSSEKPIVQNDYRLPPKPITKNRSGQCSGGHGCSPLHDLTSKRQFDPQTALRPCSTGFSSNDGIIPCPDEIDDNPPRNLIGVKTGHGDYMEGWLYKSGSMFKNLKSRWCLLTNGFLYAFHSDRTTTPSGVICLNGCFIEPFGLGGEVENRHDAAKYGIEISISEEVDNSWFLFAVDQSYRDQWVDAIRCAAKQRRFEDYYVLGARCGVGSSSAVYECTHRTTAKEYAVKIVNKLELDNRQRDHLRCETSVLQIVRHPFIIHLRQLFETRQQLFIVTNLAKGGDLFERIAQKRRFSEGTTRHVIRKILEAVRYLHDNGIVHGDLKPGNIMMNSIDSDIDLQVADFGLSRYAMIYDPLHVPCGTLVYLAPEILIENGYGFAGDMWSVGVMMYLMLRGRLPFDVRNKNDLLMLTLRSGPLLFDDNWVWNTVSPAAKDIMKGMIRANPRRRLTVYQALQHRFFANDEADRHPSARVPDFASGFSTSS